MPRKKQPARLWLRPDTGTWFIKDGARRVATECLESEVGRAQEKLAEYLRLQYQPQRGGRAAEVSVADILAVYLEEKSDGTSRPKETQAAIGRLNAFWGDDPASSIKGKSCREFADARGTEAGARRDLEVMRAAINYYHREYGLDVVPAVTLPDKSLPRERWLTRQEVASLIRAARRLKQCDHIVRLLLIGVYTGTRLSALLSLQWMPNTTGGWIDLDKQVIYRKGVGERVAHNKRRPPAKIPPRLMRFLRDWKDADSGYAIDKDLKVTIKHVIHYHGKRITKPHKAFRAVRAAAGLGEDVTPHILRHTRATWLAQAGVEPQQAAAALGMTVDEYERTYAHMSPDFQTQAANAY